jgi:hypothetical protein
MREPAAPDEASPYLFKRNPLFVAPRPGDQHILDAFPQFAMLVQVDLNGDPATLLIGDKADSAHGFIVVQVMDYS